MEVKKEEKGITMIALVITITIILILAGISLKGGKGAIKIAQIEELRTNMLLIQAKSKAYVEEATFKMGINPDEAKKIEVRDQVYVVEAQLEKANEVPAEFRITNLETCYWVTQNALEDWGLDRIQLAEDERYLIQFDEENETIEIYNTLGYDGKYSLTEVDEIE